MLFEGINMKRGLGKGEKLSKRTKRKDKGKIEVER
jgi:hypothetical protein